MFRGRRRAGQVKLLLGQDLGGSVVINSWATHGSIDVDGLGYFGSAMPWRLR